MRKSKIENNLSERNTKETKIAKKNNCKHPLKKMQLPSAQIVKRKMNSSNVVAPGKPRKKLLL